MWYSVKPPNRFFALKSKNKNFSPSIDYFKRTEETSNIKFEIKAYKVTDLNRAIVTLEYALDKGGVMEKTLLGRLEQTLAIAKLNPELPIIVIKLLNK